MKKTYRNIGILVLFLTCLIFNAPVKSDEISESRVSVHDPSIFFDKGNYYIFGSHLAQAKSTDLRNWLPMFNQEYDNPSSILGDLNKNLKKVFDWAGYDDADTSGGRYSIWAPDVLWNDEYVWLDGSKGAYMYYFSSSSTWRRSVISFAVSKNVEGPYDFQDTLIYSGFTEKSSTDGSPKDTIYARTNINELINIGTLKEGFNEKWNRNNGTEYNNDYAPNAIDPNVTRDKNGKMWMTYGSWSGGIFIVELDPTTGKVIYPGVDSVSKDGLTVDRYFGTHLIGGWHQSGEAPYIVYDQSTDYYYLFVTYGGLTREGGYNIRLFRSKKIDGVYKDARGNHPNYTMYTQEPINDQYGVKVMGNYQFNSLAEAYMSPGHNSAMIDENGNWLLFYHTRFNSSSEYHEVRVHQMLMNKEGWPIAVPFEYTGKEKKLSEKDLNQFAGNYEFVNHGNTSSGKPIEKKQIELKADKTFTGDIEGVWDYKQKDATTFELSLTDQFNNTYQGFFYRQQDESMNHLEVLTFAVVGNNNQVLWGSKPYIEIKNTVDEDEKKNVINPTDSNDKDSIDEKESKSDNIEKQMTKDVPLRNKNQGEKEIKQKSLPKTGEKDSIFFLILGVGFASLSLYGCRVNREKFK